MKAKTTRKVPPVLDIFVHDAVPGAPAVRVEERVIDHGGRVRFVAELRAVGGGLERAVLDAHSHDELKRMVRTAVEAFALSIRTRLARARI